MQDEKTELDSEQKKKDGQVHVNREKIFIISLFISVSSSSNKITL
jgi:hypothetical protein